MPEFTSPDTAKAQYEARKAAKLESDAAASQAQQQLAVAIQRLDQAVNALNQSRLATIAKIEELYTLLCEEGWRARMRGLLPAAQGRAPGGNFNPQVSRMLFVPLEPLESMAKDAASGLLCRLIFWRQGRVLPSWSGGFLRRIWTNTSWQLSYGKDA